MAKIAILGWGSLIWDQRELPIEADWTENGPVLPLEFSRKSADGRLTLVIDTDHGHEVPTRFAESARDEIEDAVCDLMHREGTDRTNIGTVDRRTRPNQGTPAHELRIWQWAVDRGFDFVVWTKLRPKIPDDWGGFSVQRAEAYLRSLPKICEERAREYIVKAPLEVQTPLRQQLHDWLHAEAGEIMTYENILLEKKNSIAYVTVNRPKVLNALNMATMEELRTAFTTIKDDREVRVAIMTGAGEKAFIAGADIAELAKHDAVSGKEYTHRGQSVLDLIENLGKPVIACINGFALGGGCEIAMACTMRLASENAKLGQPEVKLGIIPGYGGTQRLPRLVGKGIAMQLVLSGEMISAQEAHRIGLVNEVTAVAELIPRAEAIAHKIIANAPLAVQYAMEAVNKGMEMTLAEGLYLEAVLFGVACASEDKKEGTTAFLEKRAAQFKGK